MPLLDAIKRYFDRSIAIARRAGIPDHRIVLDPGIGFGKDIDDNLVILNRLEEIVALGFPVLVGTSRKRFIGQPDRQGREPTGSRAASPRTCLPPRRAWPSSASTMSPPTRMR